MPKKSDILDSSYNINFNYKGKKNSKKYKEWKKKKSALTHHDGLPKFSRQAYAVRPRVVVSGRYWKISTGSEIPFRKSTLALQTERSSSVDNNDCLYLFQIIDFILPFTGTYLISMKSMINILKRSSTIFIYIRIGSI